MRPLLHIRRFRSRLLNAYPNRATIRDTDYESNPDGYGQPVDSPTSIVGLSNIPCRFTPLIQIRPTNTEQRTTTTTEEITTGTLSFNSKIPGINPDSMDVLLDDGRVFNILGYEGDAEGVETRLRVELIRP